MYTICIKAFKYVLHCSGVNNRVNVYKHVFDSCCKQKPMFNNKKIITMAVEICGTFIYLPWMCFQLHCLRYTESFISGYDEMIPLWELLLFFCSLCLGNNDHHQCSAVTNQDVTYRRKFKNIVHVIQKKARTNSFFLTDMNQMCKLTVDEFAPLIF